MKKQDEISAELLADGWLEFAPENEQGWRFYFRRNSSPWHPYFGTGYDYKTLFPCGDTADWIIETPYQRWTRERREREKILFRKFEGIL